MRVFLSPGPGGRLARAFLPAVVVVPVVLGWLWLQGERAGYFDTRSGVWLLVASVVLVLTVLLYMIAAAAERVEAARHEAKAGLEESEQRFRQIVESVTDYAILMLNPEGRVASWNAGSERALGYRAEEVLGKHVSLFDTAEDIASGQSEQLLRRAAADGRAEEEGWRVRRDGSRFWADVVITAVRDGRGRLTGFSDVTRDITERKRGEEMFRTAVDASPNGMVMVGPGGEIVGHAYEQLVDQRGQRIFLKNDPIFDALRADSRFTRLLAALNISA